ncbi:MAG: response regulator [Bacteroidia bacterium]|nr:response regulator [Bacteroidia bacterium]
MINSFFDTIGSFSKPFVLIDLEGNLLRHNRGFEEIFHKVISGNNILNCLKQVMCNEDLTEFARFKSNLDQKENFYQRIALGGESDKRIVQIEAAYQNERYKEKEVFILSLEIVKELNPDLKHLSDSNKVVEVSQAELKRREFLLEETQKITKAGGWELDVNTGHTIWTEEVYHIHEVPLDFDHNKENGIEFYHHEDKPLLIAALENSIAQKTRFDVVLRFITAKGKLLRVRVTGHPIMEEGKVSKLIGIFQDVSKQYKIEEELKNMTERFQLAAKAADMGVWDFYPQRNELIWDETMYELYEVKKSDFSGAYEAWATSLHPESLTKAQEELGLALSGVKDFSTEFSIMLPNGGTKIIGAEAVIKRNEKGEAIRMIGVNYDITEKKKQIGELSLLHSVVESAADAILITSPSLEDHRILYSNPAHEKVTGYSAEEIFGKDPRMFSGPSTSKTELDRIEEAVKKREMIEVELLNYRKSGEPFWINMIFTYVRNEQNEVTHLVSIQRDVTDKKNAELELVKAKELAEEASRAKSEFLSVMSHEIRTPLNAVIGVCGLLDTTTKLDFEQKDLVKTIRQGGETLLSVINEVLDFSKIEAGKIELEEIEFDLASPVEDVMDLLRNQAFSKRLELLYEIEPECEYKVRGDIGRLRQILMNLVGNAIKFTSEGEVIIYTKCIEDEAGFLRAEFEVRDSGIGIPENKLNRLFRAFSQVDASTTREYGGTGLGLAIVKKLVNLMGGDVRVESEVGKGTSFFFDVLLEKVGSSERKLAIHEAYKGKKLLLVDDNKTSLAILKSKFEMMGFTVSAFHKSSELLENLQKEKTLAWDLAIIDSCMPEMSGEKLIQNLQKKEGLEALPFLLMTSEEKQRGNGQLMKVGGVLRKPVKPEGLNHHLTRILKTGLATRSELKSPHTSSQIGDFSTLSVLLVEDNLVNQKVARKILEKYNVQVEVAGNGVEGCESVNRRYFDLVFMDMQMPVLDGVGATKKIRARGENVHQPTIIAMTANTSVQDKEKCLNAGMDDFLTKPISLNSVGRILEKWSEILLKSDGMVIEKR